MKRIKPKDMSKGVQARGVRSLPIVPVPLLDGEDTALYDELLEKIFATLMPTDIFEEIWIREIADLSWEVHRLRRLKVSLLSSNGRKRLVQVLEKSFDDDAEDNEEDADADADDEDDVIELAQDWSRREPLAVKKVEAMLASANQSVDAIMARVLGEHIELVERIDRLTAMAEARRNATMREIHRHRSALGAAVRRSLSKTEDGGYRVLDAHASEDIVAARSNGKRAS